MTDEKCPECNGRGIEFQGEGLELQYKVCSRWMEPGHPSWDQMQDMYREEKNRAISSRPSGRWA